MKNLIALIALILVIISTSAQAQKDTYSKRLHVVEIVGAEYGERTQLLISSKDGELATGKVVRLYRAGRGLRSYTTVKGVELLDVKVIR